MQLRCHCFAPTVKSQNIVIFSGQGVSTMRKRPEAFRKFRANCVSCALRSSMSFGGPCLLREEFSAIDWNPHATSVGLLNNNDEVLGCDADSLRAG